MWFKSNFFKYSFGTLLVLAILVLLLQLSSIFKFIFDFILAFISPLLIGGFLFYILRPLRNFLEEKKLSRVSAIAVIYFLLILLIVFFSVYAWPFISKQISDFAMYPYEKVEAVQSKTVDIINLFNFPHISDAEIKQQLTGVLQNILSIISADLSTIITRITMVTYIAALTPFLLFYLLKDSGHFQINVIYLTPKRYKSHVKNILNDLDHALSAYITAQFVVAVIIGSLLFIGYTIIKLPYAFPLSLFALVFNMIPFLGTFISTIPALIVGFITSPWMALEVMIVNIIVHAMDANLISPNVLGPRLKVHPLTIILLLLASGSLYGVLGLLLATPVYVLVKVLVVDIYEIEKKHHNLS